MEVEEFLSAVVARTAALPNAGGLAGSEMRLTLGAAAKLGVFATLETRLALRESVLELARTCADGQNDRGLKFLNEVLRKWKVEPIPKGVRGAILQGVVPGGCGQARSVTQPGGGGGEGGGGGASRGSDLWEQEHRKDPAQEHRNAGHMNAGSRPDGLESREGSSPLSAAQLERLLTSPSSVAELFALGAHVGAFDASHTHLALGMLRQLMEREAAPLGAVAGLALKAEGERFVGAVLARTAQLALAGEIEEVDMVRLCFPNPQP